MLNELFHLSIKKWHKREHYEYQRRIADAIISGLADAQTGKTIVIPIELPRQSGKTTTVVDVVEFLLAASRRYLGFPISVAIFAPQREQATTDFDRLKLQYQEISRLGFRTKATTEFKKGELQIPEKWNSKTVRLFNAKGEPLGEVYVFPISPTSHPESKTLHIILIEEAQDADDEILKNKIFPMGAATNAVRVLVGTAGTRNCVFKSELDNNPRAIRIKLAEVFAQRKAMFELTGDPSHMLYQKFVEHEMQTYGPESDYIQRQYNNKWIIGTGQFVVSEQLDALIGKGMKIGDELMRLKELRAKEKLNKDEQKELDVLEDDQYVLGLDTAKIIDRTVATLKRRDRRDERGKIISKGRIAAWLSLQGDNYEDQFTIIMDWLKDVPNIRMLAIDATGQGDFMPDKFERHSSYNLERVKFGPETKDIIYKNLMQVIQNKLTEVPEDIHSQDYMRWRKELLELEREYKGRFLSVHHAANDKEAHDDYPDSWALAEYADMLLLTKEPSLSFL